MPTLLFEDTDQPLSSREFISFLRLFRVIYAGSLEVVGNASPEQVLLARKRYTDLIQNKLHGPFVSREAELFQKDLGGEELQFVRITKSSPLEIGCVCVVSALTLAVILSGGEVDLKGLKFKLRPLGVGIKSLRTALAPQLKKRTVNKKNSQGQEPPLLMS
jgi:hypothetical protein